MSLVEKNVTSKEKKTVYSEDSTDSENETEGKPLLRRISTSKCVGRLPVVKEGFLMKQTRSFQRWQRRYFKLRGRTIYYAKEKDSQLWDEFELEDATFAECRTNNANNSFQVITSSRCLVLCADSRGEMESWAGALRGALHRGGDVDDLMARLSCGDHQWYSATHARPTFCNVCREPFGALGTAHALACELCKFRAHKRCAARAPPSCKWSTLASLGPHLVEDAEGNIIMPHQWLEGNLPVAAKCDICDKTCGSVLRLQDFRCVWCRKSVHAACKPSWRAVCSLGAARASVVPPTRLHSIGQDDAWVPDRPTNASPLIVFVNSRSGDNQGVKFLRRFKQLLNPAQVFELSGAGPRLGLRLFRHFAPLRVLVCSGDGSVGWVLQEIDKLDMHRQVQTAVLPLGTGNDLARVLGWGASCDDAANLQQLLERYERASTKMLDRWSIMTFERAVSAPPPPPPPPPEPPDIVAESSLLNNLHEIMQAGEMNVSASSALRSGCAQLASVGERAGGAAARAAHRLRRAVSLLLHARAHLAHDHARCRFWEPGDTTSDSESEAAAPVAEKGSIEKTEKEQLNWEARGCALAGRADSVRRALRSLMHTLSHIYPQGVALCEACGGDGGGESAEVEASTLPVPRAFADSRRSSATSAVSAASLHPDNIPDVDEDIVKLITPMFNLDVDKKVEQKHSNTISQARLSVSNLLTCNTSSCKNLHKSEPDTDQESSISSNLMIPNLVVSDLSDKRDSILQGETYESDQLTIIDIDKPYTDEVHFQELIQCVMAGSGECTPDRRPSSVDLELYDDDDDDDDDTSSEGSNMSDDFSLMSEIMETKPSDLNEIGGLGGIGHIDSPEASDTTYVNSETLHGESIVDDISSMLGQDVLLAMLGKNGENETYTDDTTLFTSDTVSDLAMDSRNPSLEKNKENKLKYNAKANFSKENDIDKFGFENKVFYIENSGKPDEQKKYCSLAHFEEGNDIARKSFKRHHKKKSIRKVCRSDNESMKLLIPKTAEVLKQLDESSKTDEQSQNNISMSHFLDDLDKKNIPDTDVDNVSTFPKVSVVVEPPSPSHSEDKKSLKACASRMASVLSDIFEQGNDTLSVNSPEPGLDLNRERRQSDNPKLLGSDPEYGKFLSCSPAATRRISCGSLFKPGEPDKLSTSVSSIWGEGATGGASGSFKSDTSERAKKLPIINPLVQLPAWPHVTQGFISQCLLANADALCAAVSPLMDPDETLLEGFYEKAVMNNYFGIGIDAKITLDFHNKREEHPEKCRSRARNYMWYGVLGSKEWVNKTYRHLGQRVQLECDGQRIPLPELQGIVVLNISSFMGGTNFWGGTRGDDIFLAPSFDDRILEVVAVFGSAQMAASRLINLQKHRIAQCRAVQINILGEECVPVQVDGEAWLQPPGCVRIIHKNRAQMMCRSRALETSLRAWDEKQQMKAHAASGSAATTAVPQSARAPLSAAESAALLGLLDDVNTLVKHVKLSCISEGAVTGGSAAASVAQARRVAARADALQDSEGRLLPPPLLRRLLAALVESCHELVEDTVAVGAAVTAALRVHLARCDIHDGHAFLQVDEAPKKGSGRYWLRGRRSLSEGGSTRTTPQCGIGKQVPCWGMKEVQAWLECLQLGEYCDVFAKHDVTGRELLSLSRRDLRDLGITKVGHVKRILQAVKELQ
ncbi:diacylglycerol kinase eta isoform X2 [Cydia strobilella]|uniref:diacylglycerol kinase eta isoform X2 n=1 Tax=Cydia strobilella TaxID=1100964 RepID=UPI003004ECF0